MFLHITQAKYIADYKIEVCFNNGRKGIADLFEALKGGLFESLKNKKNFSSFVVDQELETIVWSNGVDLAPEYIYYIAFKHDESLHPQFKQWGYLS